MKSTPQDQTERERFVNELDKNFSVIAAAGAGKTTAITDRIVQIAQHPHRACEWFPRLAIVTFTNRAADEMQQRARQCIFEKNLSPDVLAAFSRSFFGTIHSFCMKLLAAHGHHLGLPARLELITDDSDLWNDFVQRTHLVGHSLSPENREALLRHVQLCDLMELGRRGKLPLSFEQREVHCQTIIDLSPLHNYRAAANATRIQALQKALREWAEQFNIGAQFLPLVECTAEGRFREIWEETFREFNEWLSCCALTLIAEVQHAYRRFRVEHGVVTFDDQISLARELTQNAAALSRIRAKDYIVILDEAQDTDPQQFDILLEITRPSDAEGRWIDSLRQPPGPGRFCMVGDFEQSIYGDRADLKQYRRIHDALVKSGGGEELKFSVTFRLDREQLAFVNKCFRDILNNADGQVGFIQMNPRPRALPGQVVQLNITAEALAANASEMQKARAEAAQLARWISQTGCNKLRARSWDQVAILCPRKKWFAPIAAALRDVNIQSQIQSETDVKGDSPAHAWFAALLTIMTQPRSGFEIVGVLREIFAISDHDLAAFSDGHGDRFQIERPTRRTGVVSAVIDLLALLHREIADEPLFTAVQKIVDETSLRQRLQTLPPGDFGDLDSELDVLLESAAEAEAHGTTVEEFAHLLRANFATEQEATAPRPGVIQLITCQKAKGLEWDAVIVPFLSRRIHAGEDDFPRIITASHEAETIVAFSNGDVPAETKNALKKSQVQEMERLLYVALTRARRTLVLASDRELFAKVSGTAPRSSMTTWFRSDHGQLNEAHISKLQTTATGCAETHAAQLREPEAELQAQPRPPLPEAVMPKAQARATEFSQRFFPSSFTAADTAITVTGAGEWKETEAEFRAATVPSAATRYGIWWHDFIQQIPWNAEPATWDAVFQSARLKSPDKTRSTREWEILRQNISNLFDVVPGFKNGVAIARAEMPFLWAINDRRCLEGIVDLALFEPVEEKWFILDWKTNQITPDKVDKLRAHYRPQLSAYWKAVNQLTNTSVDAAIYSTSTGKLVLYENDELVTEWRRLRELPLEKLALAVSGDKAEAAAQLEFANFS